MIKLIIKIIIGIKQVKIKNYYLKKLKQNYLIIKIIYVIYYQQQEMNL